MSEHHPYINHNWRVTEVTRHLYNMGTGYYSMAVLDPPYYTQSSKFYKTWLRTNTDLPVHRQLGIEEWEAHWTELAQVLRNRMNKDGLCILFEYPHNLQYLVEVFRAAGFHFHFYQFIVPTPDSPGHWQRQGRSPYLKRPASMVEAAAIFTVAPAFPQERPSLLRPHNYTNLYYDYQVRPGRNRPKACQGMKSSKILEDMFRRFAKPTGTLLDGFAGSGQVWRSLSTVLKEMAAQFPEEFGERAPLWYVDSIDSDPDKEQNGMADHTFSSVDWWPKARAIGIMAATISRSEICVAANRSMGSISKYVAIYHFLMSLDPQDRERFIARSALSEHDRRYISLSHVTAITDKLKKLDAKQLSKAVRILLSDGVTSKLTAFQEWVKKTVKRNKKKSLSSGK